jgi:hypothetical protein
VAEILRKCEEMNCAEQPPTGPDLQFSLSFHAAAVRKHATTGLTSERTPWQNYKKEVKMLRNLFVLLRFVTPKDVTLSCSVRKSKLLKYRRRVRRSLLALFQKDLVEVKRGYP